MNMDEIREQQRIGRGRYSGRGEYDLTFDDEHTAQQWAALIGLSEIAVFAHTAGVRDFALRRPMQTDIERNQQDRKEFLRIATLAISAIEAIDRGIQARKDL